MVHIQIKKVDLKKVKETSLKKEFGKGFSIMRKHSNFKKA